MKIQERLNSDSISPSEIEQLLHTLNDSKTPKLVNEHGEKCSIPKNLFDALLHTVKLMQQGANIVIFREDETMTTQAAANKLGVSRQFFVKLLESGELPFHKVGTHRRVMLKDILDYEKSRDQKQKSKLRELSKEISEAGFDNQDYPTLTR